MKEFNPTLDKSIAVYDQIEIMKDEENNQIVVPVNLDGDLIDMINIIFPAEDGRNGFNSIER